MTPWEKKIKLHIAQNKPIDENDIRKYAMIVEKAVYSNIKCSEEEARYCENLVDKLS